MIIYMVFVSILLLNMFFLKSSIGKFVLSNIRKMENVMLIFSVLIK